MSQCGYLLLRSSIQCAHESGHEGEHDYTRPDFAAGESYGATRLALMKEAARIQQEIERLDEWAAS
jgi:hypothetical protein